MRRRYDDEEEEKKSGEKNNSRKAVSDMKATGTFLQGKMDDDFKRFQRWLSFTRPRVVLGFDRVMSIEAPVMSRKLHGFSLAFSSLQGWSLPTQLLNEIDTGDFYVSVRLSLSLCHMTSKTFFGSTWLGSPVLLGEGRHEEIPDVIDFDYNEIVYILSRLMDPACVGIIEVVVSKMQRGKNVTVSQHGCGWTILPIFAPPPPPDVLDGHERVPERSSCLFTGSPRDLLVRSGATLEQDLKEMKGCHLSYKLFSHRKLLRAFKYIPENAIVGRFELVPGLAPKMVTPDEEARTRSLCCIGDTQKEGGVDNKKNRGVLCLPASPRVAKPFLLRIIDWHLLMPNRAQVESKIRVSVARNLSGKDAAECQIVARTLKIGIHNGHCLVGGDWVCDSIAEDAEDPDVLLSASQDIDVPYYIPHTHVALVLLIEYEVGVPADKNPTYDAQRTLQTTRKGNNIVTTVTIGAAAYIPMTAAGVLDLSNNTKDVREEEKLDIELGLRTDELCGVLSPNPVFNWRNGMREERTGDLSKTAAAAEDEEPVLGFDLHAFTFDRKKVEDGYKLSEADKEPAKDMALAPLDDSIEDIALAKPSSEEKESLSDDDSRETAERPRIGGSRFHPSRAPKRDDDSDSLADSIVGGDSVASVLRLSREFYAGDGVESVGDVDTFRRARGFDDLLIPKDKNSLLGRSLQARMSAAGAVGLSYALPPSQAHVAPRSAPRGLPVEDDPADPIAIRQNGMQRAVTSRAPRANFPVFAQPGSGPSAHARELSRGNRARLGRHGFLSGTDTDLARGSMDGNSHRPAGKFAEKRPIDIELDATDSLALNEVSFLFAGYRHGTAGSLAGSESVPPAGALRINRTPRSVYFTYQFFTCPPTKTEIHRLLPADAGEMNVLCRDEPHGRDEQPLSYRFSVDCSDSAPLEAVDFSEYLAFQSLQIDVWDADSLLLIGSSMFPLKRLLRQGQRGAKCALECDVVDTEFDAPHGAGGVSSLTVTDGGGPVSGVVVGCINVIAENLGMEGRRKSSSYSRHINNIKADDTDAGDGRDDGRVNVGEINPIDGLNWRALGVNKTGGSRPGNRAKNIVRARPLSESTPELSRALQDQQRYAGAGPSMRSLSSVRGNGGAHTLNYDDIMVLFKRFKGSKNGTLQYEGKLLSLLDVPSWNMAVRKLTDAVNKAMRNGDNIDALLQTYADSFGMITAADLQEFWAAFLSRYGVAYKKEELAVLSNKFIPSGSDSVKTSEVLTFCTKEYERAQWILVGKRLRNAVQKASLSGEDIEQNLAERDSDGAGYITTREFKSFLESLSQHGKLTFQDINSVCRYFARRPAEGEPTRDPVSLREVMAYLGKEYVGNLNIRLHDVIMYTGGKSNDEKVPRTISDVVKVFRRNSSTDSARSGGTTSRAAILSDIESALSELRVFDTLSHEQVRTIMNKAQAHALKSNGKFSFGVLLRFLGIDYAGDRPDIETAASEQKSPRRSEELTPELLLRQVIEHTTQHGVAVDEAFRHFDSDGNGSISAKEFIEAFEKLKIFNNIPNWKKQIPALVAKFDTSGDGDVQLKEFFDFLGVKGYSPNIEQRMTKIFAVAMDSGMSFESIYENFDSDGDGMMTVSELYDCLKQLGTFNEISKEDVSSCISKFSRSETDSVSMADFKVYFMQRVKQAQIERKERANRRNIRHFIELMDAAQSKGLTPEKVFNHFDKDGNGSLTATELSQGLCNLPQFKTLGQADVENIVAVIADTTSQAISLKAFTSFVEEHSYVKRNTSSEPQKSPRASTATGHSGVQNFITLMDAARAKGLSAEKLFCHFDKDGNGSLSKAELSSGLRKLPQFKSLTSGDIEALLLELDDDRSGAVTLDEFKAFLNRAKGDGKYRVPGSSAVEKFRKLMEVSKSKGLSAEKIFRHFDKDDSGSLTTAEFVGGLKNLPQFKTMTTEDFVEITDALDSNGDGTVSVSELEAFVTPPQADHTTGLDAFSQRVQKLFRGATAKGVSLENLFNHLDKNGNGIFDSRELEDALLKTKAFNDLSEKDIRRIMDTVDKNHDGSVTFDEFKDFVLYGVSEDSGRSPTRGKSDDALKRQGDTRELLLRHLRRISEPDGGIAGLLAFLDRDEDGEISVTSFIKLLRREGVFDTMKEGDVLDWLKPAMSTARQPGRSANEEEKGGDSHVAESKGSPRRRRGSEDKDVQSPDDIRIRVVPLMHMLDGNNPDGGSREDGDASARAQAEQQEMVLRALPEYEFSNDPEIRSLEKKLRGVGHALARRGLDVEGLFRKFDQSGHGVIRRTEFLEVLSGMGLYILEKGKALEAAGALTGSADMNNQQSRQISRLKGPVAGEQSARAARKFVMASGDLNRGGSAGEFQDHLESMALINWYRQSQKHMLIQRVLSHSLAAVEKIYPRFGKTLFFEHPITNPFSHEERFLIEFDDAEMRLVTNLDEWMQLRQCCRPCVGKLGSEPIEGDMFDMDGHGHVQVSLLPQETLYIPFTFLTLVPYTPLERKKTKLTLARRSVSNPESKDDTRPLVNNKEYDAPMEEVQPTRSIEVKFISGTHGHVVANLVVEVCPLPCVVDRVFRFFEPENSVMKRRIRLVGCDDVKMFPGEAVMSSKYVHCVENGAQPDCRVVVEWGPSGAGAASERAAQESGIDVAPAGLDILLRYRCSGFPGAGDFYILLFNDPYQSSLHEIWHVVVQSRQRLDVNSSVGSTASIDLVVRGDRFSRRARVFGSSSLDRAIFDPSETFQLVPMAYNRVLLKYSPTSMGSRRLHINMIDVDSRELVSSWVLVSSATAPDVLRQYEVQGVVGVPQTKKIVFQNPWDVPRRFVLTSSNEAVMRPRMHNLDIGPQGSEYLRLWFAGIPSGHHGTTEVFLFLNDESGHSEESFLFRIHSETR